MNFLFSLYNELLWRPLFNGLVFFYTYLPFHDLGLAIVALTLAIRLLLTPLLWKAQRAQKELASLQPEIKKIQTQLKNDREAQGKALMELYATRGINPFSGCLILLIQLPILIALFQVFQYGFAAEKLVYLYSFLARPEALNPVSFGFLDLSRPNLVLGALAALTQFLQTKLMLPSVSRATASGSDMAAILQWQSLYVLPLIVFFSSYQFPSALLLYWTVLSTLGILQEILMKRFSRFSSHGSGTGKK